MRIRLIERSYERFAREPVSVRAALSVLVLATVATTFIGAFCEWLFNRQDFPNYGEALWWAVQTVTTVGYGDVTPKSGVGRLIGALVLVYSIGFLAILTATITSSFVERARRDHLVAGEDSQTEILERLDRISARLDRLERAVAPRDEAPPE